MRALIIEDEINAYEYLVSMVQSLRNDLQIVDHIDSVEDAINFFHGGADIDLVFMDIQLSDGLSFEIFKHVEVKIPIIFTTA
jgi:DNA-binding LytR/AlgR family response regulator